MIEFIYIFYLLYVDNIGKSSEIIDLQINNITLILANDIFATTKRKELKEAKLLAKDREKLILNTLIKFIRG